MRTRLSTTAGGTCVTVLLAGTLAACSGAPDSGGPGPGKAVRDDARHPSSPAPATPPARSRGHAGEVSPHPYAGMWVTADGHIRQELLPNGRYDEARGERESAYTGSYQVSGTWIDYRDDTGFTADGIFKGDVLHHGGYLFYREGSDAHQRAKGDQR